MFELSSQRKQGQFNVCLVAETQMYPTGTLFGVTAVEILNRFELLPPREVFYLVQSKSSKLKGEMSLVNTDMATREP